MTIKAAFFDIDGTLFSHKSGHVPPSTEKAIARLRENGIITAICTGRHDQEVRRVNLASLKFDYTITLNGQMIRDSEGRLVKAFPFKSDDIAAIEDLFKQKKIAIMAIEEDDIPFPSELSTPPVTNIYFVFILYLKSFFLHA